MFLEFPSRIRSGEQDASGGACQELDITRGSFSAVIAGVLGARWLWGGVAASCRMRPEPWAATGPAAQPLA